MAVKHEDLWTRWLKQGDREAREQLAESYLWLVRYVAGRLMIGLPPQYDQEDVEGYGCFGLLDAIDKYDPARGVRFETYAIPWVRGACIRGLKAMQWAPGLRKRVREIETVYGELEVRLGRAPTEQEVARSLGISAAEVGQRIQDGGLLTVLSLEESAPDGERTALVDRLVDPAAEDPSISAQYQERREQLALAVESLPEKERLVVSLYYVNGLTLKEISKVLGVTPARISQLHSKAILRLRGKLARLKELMVS